MSSATINFKIDKWPFPSDIRAYVHLICSPIRDAQSGNMVINVLFTDINNQTHSKMVRVSWGLISQFWIGRIFQDGSPTNDNFYTATQSVLKLNTCYNYEVRFIKKNLSSFINRNVQEYYIDFYCSGSKYRISCIEIVRAFYAFNTAFANQLFHNEGLENLIIMDSWKQSVLPNSKTSLKVEFTFNLLSKVPPNSQNALHFTALFSSPKLRSGYNSVKAKYRSNMGKIFSELPRISNGEITVSSIPLKDGTSYIIHILPKLSVPYSQIEYGPAAKEKVGPSNGKTFSQDIPSEEVIIVTPAECTKRTNTESVSSGVFGLEIANNPIVRRQSRYPSDEMRSRMIPKEALDLPMSTGTSVTSGGYTPLNVETAIFKSEHLTVANSSRSNDPDFALIISAMNQLENDGYLTTFKYSICNLTDYCDAPFAFVSGYIARKCILFNLQSFSQQYYVFEVSLKDDYSLSILILKTTYDDKKVLSLLTKILAENGGHWKSSVLKQYNCLPLAHHHKRTPELLAINLYKKLLALA